MLTMHKTAPHIRHEPRQVAAFRALDGSGVGKAFSFFVSNSVDFPDLALDLRGSLPSFLAAPTPRTHAVQFYDEDSFLFDTVGSFLSAGLAAGDTLFVIATQPHAEGFLRRVDPRALEQGRAEGRITVLDARATLAQLMVGDMPDPRRFQELLAD